MSDRTSAGLDRAGSDTIVGSHGLQEIADQSSWIKQWRHTFLHAYSMVGNRADAEDLAQETYLRLFQRSQAAEPIESFTNWMRVVVRTAMHRHLSKTRPHLHIAIGDGDAEDEHPALLLADHELIFMDHKPSIEQKVIDENLARKALGILANLSNVEKECVMMYARGYSFVQIARALGLPYRKTIRITTRAVANIRSKIEELPREQDKVSAPRTKSRRRRKMNNSCQ